MAFHLAFVLSGFLITTLCLRGAEKRGACLCKAFLVRRSARILPLYFVALFTYCAFVFRTKSRHPAKRHSVQRCPTT